MRGDTGFLTDEMLLQRQVERNDMIAELYPAVLVEGHLVHVFQENGRHWQVWVNTEDLEFTGLCVGTGETRDEAIAVAVKALEAIVEHLQSPQ